MWKMLRSTCWCWQRIMYVYQPHACMHTYFSVPSPPSLFFLSRCKMLFSNKRNKRSLVSTHDQQATGNQPPRHRKTKVLLSKVLLGHLPLKIFLPLEIRKALPLLLLQIQPKNHLGDRLLWGQDSQRKNEQVAQFQIWVFSDICLYSSTCINICVAAL